eukprot:COSAG01_NODE_10349_length_2187_cov_4.830709_1_plen_136_part_00
MHLRSPVHMLTDSAQDAEELTAIVRLAEATADAEAAKTLAAAGVGEPAGGGPAAAAEAPPSRLGGAVEAGLAAARAGDVATLRRLVNAGEFNPLGATDSHGSGALHWAAGGGALATVRPHARTRRLGVRTGWGAA